jgi:hypothetical protein
LAGRPRPREAVGCGRGDDLVAAKGDKLVRRLSGCPLRDPTAEGVGDRAGIGLVLSITDAALLKLENDKHEMALAGDALAANNVQFDILAEINKG